MVQNWIDELWSQNNDLNIINDIHVKIIGKPMNNVIARWSVAPMVEAASPITSTFAEPFNLTMISSSTNYQLQLAKIIQYHPVSSSVFQLPIICVYIYIYTHTLYIYTHLPLTIDIPIANQVHQLQWSNLRRQDASSLSKVVEVAPGVCRGNSGGVSTSYKDQLVRILNGV